MGRISRSRYLLISMLVGVGIVASLAFAAGFSHRNTYRYLSVFQEVWALTNANYVEPVDEPELLRGAYEGMLSSLDAVSGYISQEHEKLLATARGPARTGFEVLPSGGVPIIIRVDPGTPAEEAGLVSGDQVWKIGDQATRNLSWPILSRLFAGKAGKTLDLVVFDSREFKLREVSIVLAPVSNHGFSIEVRGKNLLYLRIRNLDLLDPVVLGLELQQLQTIHPTHSLLIDLRGVVALDSSVITKLSGRLLPGGPLLQLVPRQGNRIEVTAPVAGKPSLPASVFVLTNSATAGMAEALALLLEEKVHAVRCGRKTYGLGVVPEVIPLRSGGSVLLSTRQMQSMEGTTWAKEGLKPAKEFPLRTAFTTTDEEEEPGDYLLGLAEEWIASGAALETPSQEERAAS